MIFPTPKHEEYFHTTYTLKTIEQAADLVYLYHKFKNNNEEVVSVINDSYGEEQYDLEISEDKITITHKGDSGFFRAVTSLSQLIKEYGKVLPCCKIKDQPDFERRGYMLDVSRGRIPKKETIMKLIDLLAKLKYNELQLYMESLVFKYKAFPKYTAGYDCLTPEDIRFLDAYCKERFIDLVPNQNSLGHLGNWLKYEEFSHLKIGGKENPEILRATLNPLLEESFLFIDKLYESLLPYFDSDYVHIGLDEAFELDKYELAQPCQKCGKDTIFMEWLCKLSEHIEKKYHKKVQFWADMIYSYPEAFRRMPENATAVIWGYAPLRSVYLAEKCRNLSEKNCDFYVCAGDSTWKSLTGRFDVMTFNIRSFADIGKKYGAKGYLLASWGNLGHAHFPLWSYVSCALAGLYSWNTGVYSEHALKQQDIWMTQKFIDQEYFNGHPISKHLALLQRYYHLEPTPIHDQTNVSLSLTTPVFGQRTPDVQDLYDENDILCFENVISYLNRNLEETLKYDINEDYKKQIICNVKSVIFAAELSTIRINQFVAEEKRKEVISLAEEITALYRELWTKENYEQGIEVILDLIEARKVEVEEHENDQYR